MVSLHGPRAHEQSYANANWFIVKHTSCAPHRALRVRRGGQCPLTDEQDDSVFGGVCPASASELLNL